ncbi:MAG: ATP synthase F1 subunit gamma [Clostridiales bacterium]|nr:ATP synthase F1 subunit gamma [Clostridiales bacterium]
MLNLPDLKRRIATVKQTRQITGAMETISVSKMRKSLETCEKAKPYIDGLTETLDAILCNPDEALSEYIAPPKDGLDVVIVISSDKGLCGSYNHEIIKAADAVVNDNSFVIPIGQTAKSHFCSAENVDFSFSSLSESIETERINALSSVLLDWYGTKIKSAAVVYGKLVSGSVTSAVTKKLLPLEPSKSSVEINKPEFEPSPRKVLDGLLPLYISGMIYGALLDSAAAEHSARSSAMTESGKNADAMIEMLSLEYSRARQASVTNQITEIIGSRQALDQAKKGDR